MRLLEFFNGFLDIFRSRYVRYLEAEVVRLRGECAALNHTLLAQKGIQQIATPDMQDLSARGQKLRHDVMAEKGTGPRNVVKRGTHAILRRDLEQKSRDRAAEIEQEIASRREEKEKINAAQ
jgi:hypothetical protein